MLLHILDILGLILNSVKAFFPLIWKCKGGRNILLRILSLILVSNVGVIAAVDQGQGRGMAQTHCTIAIIYFPWEAEHKLEKTCVTGWKRPHTIPEIQVA